MLKLQESKTLEFKSTLRWNLKEDRKDNRHVTHAALKTIAAFLNTEGGDLLIGVDDKRRVIGIGHDRLDTDDKFMLHLAQTVRNGLGDHAGTCIDPRTQIVGDKTVCLVSCQRSPEPVYLQWKGMEKTEGAISSTSGAVQVPSDSPRTTRRSMSPADSERQSYRLANRAGTTSRAQRMLEIAVDCFNARRACCKVITPVPRRGRRA